MLQNDLEQNAMQIHYNLASTELPDQYRNGN